MDGPALPASKFKPVEQGAVEFMLEIIRASEEKITLVPTAPLTNIALLIMAYPEVKERIEKISLMGGGLAYGNVTRTAEFNIYVDPEAARIVFESGIPIVMSGLDVTDKAAIFEEEIQEPEDARSRVRHGRRAAGFLFDLREENGLCRQCAA